MKKDPNNFFTGSCCFAISGLFGFPEFLHSQKAFPFFRLSSPGVEWISGKSNIRMPVFNFLDVFWQYDGGLRSITVTHAYFDSGDVRKDFLVGQKGTTTGANPSPRDVLRSSGLYSHRIHRDQAWWLYSEGSLFYLSKNLSLNNSKFSINYNRCGKV